jgi:hypothetical protein
MFLSFLYEHDVPARELRSKGVHDDAVNTAEFDSAPDGGSFPELQLRILANESSSLLRVVLGMNLDWVPIHSLLMTSSSIKESSPQFWRLLYPLVGPPTCSVLYK